MTIAIYNKKGEAMKKVAIFILTVTIIATVFSGLMPNIPDREATPILDQLTPAIAYADSDTLGNRDVPPPPPPIN
jgi:hypothetical protein